MPDGNPDYEAIQEAAEAALRAINSPATKAALETHRRDIQRIADLTARAARLDAQRRIAASDAFQRAQTSVMRQVAEASAAQLKHRAAIADGVAVQVAADALKARARITSQASEAVAEYLAANERSRLVAVRALQSWTKQQAVNASLARLATAAKAREAGIVDLVQDHEAVESLAEAPAPSEAELSAFDEALELDAETDAAVDAAASQLMVSFPTLTRAHARVLVVFIVYVSSVGALVGMSFIPVLGAIPGALGWDAPKASDAAGRAFDRVLPPTASDIAEDDQQDDDAPPSSEAGTSEGI